MRGFGGRRPSDAEHAVVAAILQSSADPRAEVLLQQFAHGPVSRSRRGNTLQVTLDYTTADLMVDLDDEVRSDGVRVHNVSDGYVLEFHVQLAPGGFFRGLWGVADQAWPRRWSVAAGELAVAARGALRFEPAAGPGDPQVLAELLGTSPVHLGGASWRQPACAEDLVAVEEREGQPIPDRVRALLMLADGVTAGSISVLGARDLSTVDVEPGRVMWLVGVDAEGTHYVSDGDGVVAFEDGRAELQGGHVVAPGYLAWVRAITT